MPDDVLAKLPDVVAHQYEELPLRARLLILLLGSHAVAEKIPSDSRRLTDHPDRARLRLPPRSGGDLLTCLPEMAD